MLGHGGYREPGVHGFLPNRYGRCGQTGAGEATSGDGAEFGSSVAFGKDGAAAIWAKIIPDLESAVGCSGVNLRRALQPNPALRPTRCPLHDASASPLAG